MAKNTLLSHEQALVLSKLMFDKGYLTHERVYPEQNIETDVPCPVCGKLLDVYSSGRSYRIKCKTEGCIVRTVRGI